MLMNQTNLFGPYKSLIPNYHENILFIQRISPLKNIKVNWHLKEKLKQMFLSSILI